MMNSMRLVCYLMVVSANICLGLCAKAQLKVGDYLPKERLEELKLLGSADFPYSSRAPKLYILDFWSRGCGTCIASFPKMEGLQYQFKDEIKIIAINPWDDDEKLPSFFELQSNGSKRTATSKHAEDPTWTGSSFIPRMTSLPASNGDISWLDLIEIQSVPRHIWLDADGRIIAMPWGYSANAHNIEWYLRTGKLPRMLRSPVPGRFPLWSSSIVEQWGVESFPYRKNGLSIRSFYEGSGANPYANQRAVGVVDTVSKTIRYSFINNTIADLYKAAWLGVFPKNHRPTFHWGRVSTHENGDTAKFFDIGILDNRIIWEVSQPAYYIGPKAYGVNGSSMQAGFDDWCLRAQFCAELILPLAQQRDVSRIFMDGLNRYFFERLGITARIEERPRVCLVLKKDKDFQSLASSADTIYKAYDSKEQLEHYINHPLSHVLLDFLPYRINHAEPTLFRNVRTNSIGKHYYPMLNDRWPLINETDITNRVDIALHVVPDDVTDPVEALNYRLKGTGLHVEKEVRDMEVLVISDQPKNPKKMPKGVYRNTEGKYEYIYD